MEEELEQIILHTDFDRILELALRMREFAIQKNWAKQPVSGRGLEINNQMMRRCLEFVNNLFVAVKAQDNEKVDDLMSAFTIAKLLESIRKPIPKNALSVDERALFDSSQSFDSEWLDPMDNFIVWWIRNKGNPPDWVAV